jgi:hypothetical protein
MLKNQSINSHEDESPDALSWLKLGLKAEFSFAVLEPASAIKNVL